MTTDGAGVLTVDKSSHISDELRCSVVVTTWRRPVLLSDTLASLTRQSYRPFEIIVVCDGEDADVRAIARDFREECPVRWIFHPVNRGLPAARNTGARAAQGDIVLFLDDDVVADSELITAHMGHYRSVDQHRRLAVWSLTNEDRYTPASSYMSQRLHEAWKEVLNAFSVVLGATGTDSIGEKVELFTYFGLNCSIRRDLFLNMGGFNEFFRDSDEEREFGMRLYVAGVEFIFEPRRLLTHFNSKDMAKYLRQCWGASGALDTYRVFELGQKNAQTQQLVSMFHGSLRDRVTARCAWRLSKPLVGLSKWIENAANLTRWRVFFSGWTRLCQPAEYWSHVKAAGCTTARLKSAVGPSKCALMFHSISEPMTKEETAYCIAPRNFQRLMRRFRAAGYRTLTQAEWFADTIHPKHVLLTFDDAYEDLYEELLPLVIEYRYTPLIFLVVDRIGASNVWDQERGLRVRDLLTLEQIREMQKYGVEFGSHSLTHASLPGVSDAQLRREVGDSKHRLEDLLGAEVISFAYPYGEVDRRVRSAVSDAGYKLAFTAIPGVNWWNDPLCQRRAEVNDTTGLLDFMCELRYGRNFRGGFRGGPRRLGKSSS
jgi:peptidoglycan/xylan/chitin deacetylase (PgdA/CDA1 family)